MKQKRKTLGYTQMQLAVMARVSLPTIQNIEMGKANPTLKLLEKIGIPLRYSPEFISQDADWNLLQKCGLPLETATPETQLKPTPSHLAQQLFLAIQYLFFEKQKKEKRLEEAVMALLLAIHHYYPSYYAYCLDTPKINSLVSKYTLSGRMIKLIRMSSSKLSEIL